MKAQSAAPVFHVSNLDTALKYYKDVLGFREDFRFGQYAGVKLGEFALHLSAGMIITARSAAAPFIYFAMKLTVTIRCLRAEERFSRASYAIHPMACATS